MNEQTSEGDCVQKCYRREIWCYRIFYFHNNKLHIKCKIISVTKTWCMGYIYFFINQIYFLFLILQWHALAISIFCFSFFHKNGFHWKFQWWSNSCRIRTTNWWAADRGDNLFHCIWRLCIFEYRIYLKIIICW